jgi:hypothetical protein
MHVNRINVACKITACLLSFAAAVLGLAGHPVDMGNVLPFCGFLAAAFMPVDVSKIRENRTGKGGGDVC